MVAAKQAFGARRSKTGEKRKATAKSTEHADAAAKRAAMLLTIAAAVEIPPAASPVPPATQQTSKQRQCHGTPHEEHLKRTAIEYHYAQYRYIGKALWSGHNGVVSRVRDAMGLGPDRKHRECIERTLAAIVAEQGTRARGGGYEGQGRAELLMQREALIAAHELRTGRGQTQARFTVNAWRAKKGKGPVSRSAMRTSIFKLGVKRHGRRESKPMALHSDCNIALAARNEVFALLDPQ